jgi:hypothetical protein
MKQSHTYLATASILSAYCFVIGCASVPMGERARPIDATGKPVEGSRLKGRLEVSGMNVPALASRHFGMIVITFENNTSSWQYIRDVRISLSRPDLNKRVVVPSGRELEAWLDATWIRNDYGLHSTEHGLFAAGLGDWISRVRVGHRAHTPGPQPAPTAQALQTIAQLRASPLPEHAYLPEHLFDEAISVPPGLFAKRWIVLNTPNDLNACIRGLVIDFTAEEHRESVWLPVETRGSEWQNDYCFR